MGIFYDPDAGFTSETEAGASAGRLVVIERGLLGAALTQAPDEIRRQIEAGAQEVASSLVVTTTDVRKVVREVAADFNFKLSDDDVNLVTRRLIEKHLEEGYIRERIDDHLGEQAEETLKELRFDLGEGG